MPAMLPTTATMTGHLPQRVLWMPTWSLARVGSSQGEPKSKGTTPKTSRGWTRMPRSGLIEQSAFPDARHRDSRPGGRDHWKDRRGDQDARHLGVRETQRSVDGRSDTC